MLMEMFDDDIDYVIDYDIDDDTDDDDDDTDDEIILETIDRSFKQVLFSAASLCGRKRKMPTRTEDYVERNEHENCEGESQQHFRMNRVDFESASTCWKEEHNMIEQVCAENQLSSDENAHTKETRQTTPQKAPVPLSPAAQSPSTSSSPSASTTQSQYSDFCDRRSSCKKRKRTAAEPPQWFLEYAIIQRKNMKSLLKKEFQERNLLLKQRNNLLNDRNRILNDQINILKERNELLKSYIQQRLQPRPGSLK